MRRETHAATRCVAWGNCPDHYIVPRGPWGHEFDEGSLEKMYLEFGKY